MNDETKRAMREKKGHMDNTPKLPEYHFVSFRRLGKTDQTIRAIVAWLSIGKEVLFSASSEEGIEEAKRTLTSILGPEGVVFRPSGELAVLCVPSGALPYASKSGGHSPSEGEDRPAAV